MDREIPKEVRNKERNKKIIRFSAIGIVGIIGISVLISLLRTGVQKKDLVFSTVDKGTIEVRLRKKKRNKYTPPLKLKAKQTYTTKHDEMIYLTMIIHVAV